MLAKLGAHFGTKLESYQGSRFQLLQAKIGAKRMIHINTLKEE